MTPYLLNHYGNTSSHHAQGRQARQAIEQCRATIAGLPDEIVFTSGGTEADNTAVLTAVHGYGIKHVITTRFEHHGGGLESRLRAGTENIHGIVGLKKALETAYDRLNEHQQHIQGLKNYMIAWFTAEVPDVTFNGNSTSASQSLYTVLNVGLPALNKGHILLRCLDDAEIVVSGASACSTGSASHVLQAIAAADNKVHIRFSFSKFNTRYEIDRALEALHQIYHTLAA
jgi:cysteine sulfinate desulfinase/cysteine desulfurase-like protein